MTQLSEQITPIGEDQMAEVTALTSRFIREAEKLFSVTLEQIPVTFDLKGRSAGMFRIKNGVRQIRFNPWIFSLHYSQNLHDTVPHEVAHYVVNALFGQRNIKPHGREWQNIMISLGREPKTTCDFSIEGVPKRQLKEYPYRCDCREHNVTSIRHNRILRGQTYLCRHCRSRLAPIKMTT